MKLCTVIGYLAASVCLMYSATAWTQGKAGAAGTLANSGTFRITQNKKGNEVTLEDFTHPEAVKVTTRTFLFGGKSPNNDIITFKDPSDVSK